MIKVGSRVRVKDSAFPNDNRLHGGRIFVVKRVLSIAIILDAQGLARNAVDEFTLGDHQLELVKEIGYCSVCDATTPGRDICCDCKKTQ
jgi:hypothetical protein